MKIIRSSVHLTVFVITVAGCGSGDGSKSKGIAAAVTSGTAHVASTGVTNGGGVSPVSTTSVAPPTSTTNTPTVQPPTWRSSAAMSRKRAGHTAVVLLSGKVLITGGFARLRTHTQLASITDSAELYDPVTDTFTTVGSMRHARANHQAVLLPTGNVLITGGEESGPSYVSYEPEIYDATLQTFSPVIGWPPRVSLHTVPSRQNGCTVTLANGGTPTLFRVWIWGGQTNTGYPVTASQWFGILRPTLGMVRGLAWGQFAQQPHPHQAWHAAVPYTANGQAAPQRLLTIGGTNPLGPFLTANPNHHLVCWEWAETGAQTAEHIAPNMPERVRHTATVLDSGKILILGGTPRQPGNHTPMTGAIVHDHGAGSFRHTAGVPISPRVYHTVTAVSGSRVVVTGGLGFGGRPLASVELYDEQADRFRPAAPLSIERVWHKAVRLPNGDVFVTGGTKDGVDALTTTERYTP